jgi:hypothetical protein
MHHLHRGDSHTRQKRSWYALAGGEELDQGYLQAAGCCTRSWDVASDESAITFEFIGKIASAGAVTEPGDIECGA